MKLIADRENLADKLKKAFRFVPSKTLVTAQGNFMCVIRDKVMEITAGDSQSQVKIYCPVKNDEDFSFCVEASLFLKTISLFRENEVRITKKSDTMLELKNGKASAYKISMDCLPEDFPVMARPVNKHELSLPQAFLKMGIKITEKFIDDEAVTNASGINIDVVDRRLVFTGAHDYMLCRVNVAPLSVASWDKNIVLPPETAVKILSLLNDKAEIAICHDKEKVVFFINDQVERFEITSTLVDKKYPNSEAVFNKKGQGYAVINTLEFKDVFMRLKLYTEEKNSDKTVKMFTNPENVNELILTASSSLKPKEGNEAITIRNISGKPIKKGFNSGAMLKLLANIESNELAFFFTDDDRVSCFIDPIAEGNGENNFNFVISSCM